jgi:hypothetical protein
MSYLDLAGSFDQRKIQNLRHQLTGHPLMTLHSLAELALRLEPRYVRFHNGIRHVDTCMGEMLAADRTRKGLRSAIDNLHAEQAFVQIINVRADPAYRKLVDEVLDELAPRLPAGDRRLLNRDAAAFLASPRSVTPFHLDHEQNFVCHLRGAKTFYLWDHRDRSVVGERALEIFYREGSLREALYHPSMQPKARSIDLQPGDCVYMPMGSPHAAVNGDDVTVTFSVLMNTRSSFELVESYRVNHALRRLGLTPVPVGISQVYDACKRYAAGAVRWARARVRGARVERRLQWY